MVGAPRVDRDSRSPQDRALDAALLLYFIKEVDPVYGRTKAQKAAFFVEFALDREGMRGSHYPFFRWDNGPFSRVLWNDLDALCNVGCVSHTVSGYEVTSHGLGLVDLVLEIKADQLNNEAFLAIDDVLAWCKPKTGEELIKAAYAVKMEPAGMPGEALTIKEIPLGIDIIVPEPGGLHVDSDLLAILEEQLPITRAQVDELRRDATWQEEADIRLREAVTTAAQRTG